MNNDPTISSQSRPLPHQRVWLWYKRRSKIGKLGCGCLSLIALVLICSICGIVSSTGSSTGNKTQNSKTSTPVTQMAQRTTPKPTTKPLTPEERIAAISKENGGTDDIYVDRLKSFNTTIILDFQWSNSTMRDSVKMKCFDMQEALWTASPPLGLKTVVVFVNGDVVDKYGKESKSQVGFCTLKSEIAAKFNWSNLTWRTAWEAYDNKGLAPFLQNA